jgi:outer membrane protein TolC
MYRFALGGFLAALALARAASGADSLSLSAAMAGGRAQAREVVAATARTAAAEARAREAGAWRLPQVRLSETWTRTDSPADAFGLQLNQERFSFPAFVAGNPNAPDPLTAAITRLEVEIPVWTGGELSTRVAQARFAAAAAAAGQQRAADQAAVSAAEAWIRLAQAREGVSLLERARATVATHVENARAYSEQGMVVRSELLRAEVELARIDDLLSEARGQARVAESNLAFRLGEPLATERVLAPLAPLDAIAGGLDEWLAGTEARGDLDAARQLLAAGELEAKALRARLLPHVGVIARHDLVDDSLFGAHGDSTTVAALATFDLFDGGRKRAAVAAARAEADAGRADVDRFAEGVRLETRQTFEAAQVAIERRRTAVAALAAADENVRILEERYRAGVVRTLEVLDAVTARREAETRELVARAESWLAAFRLSLASGRPPESILTASTPTPGGA